MTRYKVAFTPESWAIITQMLENSPEMLLVLLWRGTSDKEVVYVDVTKIPTTEHLINEVLKGLGSIAETEWHSEELKLAKWCSCGSTGIW